MKCANEQVNGVENVSENKKRSKKKPYKIEKLWQTQEKN